MTTDIRSRLRRGLLAAALGLGMVATSSVVLPAPPAQAALTGSVQFSGHGWGHGRGLGQWGAYGYAVNSGWNYSTILSHFYGGTSQSVQPNSLTSVALTGQDARDLVVTSARDFTVGGILVSGGSAARVQALANGTFQLSTSSGCAAPAGWTTTIPSSRVAPTSDPGNDLQAMLTLCTYSGTKQYRGELSVLYTGGIQRTVNTVFMEDYLRGVVPRESPASWGDGGGGRGMEALKAQAVAARSYAYAENRSSYAKTCDTTSCQVYLGAGTNYGALEDQRTDTAIAATSGVVLRNGANGIVRAEFSASTGGYSAGGTFPAVPDDGDANSPHHNWTTSVAAMTIASSFGVGELQDITVIARNGLGQDGGRVTQVRIVGSSRTVVVSGNDVRSKLGLKSDWFVIDGVVGGVPVPPAAGGDGGSESGSGPAAPAGVVPTAFLASRNANGAAATGVPFGEPGDVVLACDWDGNGVDSLGVFRAGTFYLTNTPRAARADVVFGFGQAGDQPVCGDWDGDGRDTVGLYRDGTVFLRNSLTTGVADGQFLFGAPGDRLVVGDWNGDRYDTVGVWRPGAFYLAQSNIRPSADVVLAYGAASDLPVVGDWDGNGSDTVGVYRSGVALLRNQNTPGGAQLTFAFGAGGDAPMAGRWAARGADLLGVTRGY